MPIPSRLRDWFAGALLFAATAAVVIWQNARLGVLWDLSYILENAYRISVGQIPYRDFPLPYPPLTFVTQAAVIKLTGRVFYHHIIYSTVAGGIATVLTWRIVLRLLRAAERPRTIAFLLTAPLIVLGIYCVFPHPFYDCDCAFAILASILLLLYVEEKSFPPALTFVAGMALVIPALVKQNTGFAFLGSAVSALIVLSVIEKRSRRALRGHGLALAGVAAGIIFAALILHFAVGLRNYQYWTMQYAAARRMPSVSDMLDVYRNSLLLWWLLAFAAGALLLVARGASRWRGPLAAILLFIPFLWTVVGLFTASDPSDQAECLLALWPFLLVVSIVVAFARVLATRLTDRPNDRKTDRPIALRLLLPFIVIATIHGALLSQQVWGSTYAIWPLAIILVASTWAALASHSKPRASSQIVLAAVIAACLLISGGHYIWTHERLDYADVSDGAPAHSSSPALRGLTVRGAWLRQFDELMAYVNAHIPAGDGILMIPGEDLFYYATGRVPRFPVLMFDHTVNPYSPEEILQLARQRDIRWLIIKRDLQLESDPVEDRARLQQLLRQDFTPVEELDNYDMYQRALQRGAGTNW